MQTGRAWSPDLTRQMELKTKACLLYKSVPNKSCVLFAFFIFFCKCNIHEITVCSLYFFINSFYFVSFLYYFVFYFK